MSSGGLEREQVVGTVARFVTTHWSVVLGAGHGSEAAARQALERLCQAYWYPLYAYVRRRGYSVEDAEDLIQEFFALLLRRGDFSLPNPARGKFRSFLLSALNHFLVDDWRRNQTKRRGGQVSILSLDRLGAERRYLSEPKTTATPEREFEKQWALTLLDHVLKELEEECRWTGKAELFEALKDSVWGDQTARSYAELGRQWGMTEGAVKGVAHRLRRRYRELLLTAIAQTVSSPEELEEEVHALIAALSE